MIGYLFKNKLKEEYLFLKYLEEFNEFYYSNLVLYKNNSVKIINNYIIMHKNKNANYVKLFLKNNNIISYNEEILKFYIFDNHVIEIIKRYLNDIGKNEYNYESEKCKNFSSFLKTAIDKSEENYKNRGGLTFKILLAIGAVVAIIIW